MTGVIISVLLCLRHHALNFLFGQPPLVVRDRDLVGLAARLVRGVHVQHAVCVQIKHDLNLRHAPRRRRNAVQLELTQNVVVLCELALAFKHLDQHPRLVVRVRGKGLALLARNGGVALNELGHHAASRLNAQRQRRHVQQQDVLRGLGLVARQNGRLHRGAVCHRLIRINGAVQLLAVEVLGQQRAHLGDARGSAHQHNLVDAALGNLGIPNDAVHGVNGASEQVHAQLLKLGTRDLRRKIHAVKQRVHFNRGFRRCRQGALGALACRPESAQRPVVSRWILLVLAFELLQTPRHDAVVKILATQVRVSSRGLHLKNAVVNCEQRNVKRAASQVKNQNVELAFAVAFALFVQAVRNRRRRGLVNDAQHVQPRNGASVFGGLALPVVEIRGHGDDRIRHRGAQIALRNFLHFRQNHGRNFLRRKCFLLALEFHLHVRLAAVLGNHLERPMLHVGLNGGVVYFTADEALRIKNGVLRVHADLVLRCIADEALRIRECHVRWGGTIALVVGNDFHALVLPHTDARIRGA